MISGWIGVDFDGTLAEYHGWEQNGETPGPPVPAMRVRVVTWLKAGIQVRIVTARASVPEQVAIVEEWCARNLGMKLPVTDRKDFAMCELWDDRAVQIEMNTGRRVDGR